MPTFPVSIKSLFSSSPSTPVPTAPAVYQGSESSSSDEFLIVDDPPSLAASEHFEVYDPPPDTVEHDFTYVPEADGIASDPARILERALPPRVVGTVDSTVGNVKRAANTLANTPALASKATSAALGAMKNEFMESNPFDPRTYNPARYMATGLAAGTATMVGVATRTSQGMHDEDYEASINLTEAFLRRATAGFSQEQIATVKTWIAEARKGLHHYQKQNYKNLNEAMQQAPLPVVEEIEEEVKAPDGTVTKRMRPVVRAPAPTPTGPQKVTFNTLMKGVEEVTTSINPDRNTLQDKMPALADTLEALEKVRAIPCRISTSTQTAFYERYDADRCMGSREFINSLVTQGGVLVENAQKPANEQTKRILIAISGPGTAKTTNIKKLAGWVNQPLCMLTGEEFCKMKIPHDKNAFDVFEEWVQQRMLEHFTVDHTPVINGILLLDDFHFALEGNGPFALDSDARTKFFHFLKNLGDANQENVVKPVELAPKRFMPLNLVRTQIFITLNRLPRELQDDGEEALTSRCSFINVAYPNDEDRRFTAHEHTAKDLRNAIMARTKWTEETLAEGLNMTALNESLEEIVKLDSSYAKTFDGQLGVRALADLLSRYKQHVTKKLETSEVIAQDIFAFSGTPPFDPVKIAHEIKDYKKGRDENLARIEAQKQQELRLVKLTKAIEELPEVQKGAVKELLKDMQDADFDKRRNLLDSAQRRLHHYTNRLPLPDAKDFGRALLAQFGYLKSRGADGEADRFSSIANVARSLYFKRAAARTTGYRDNQVVRVKFADPSALDTSIITELARILGNVPVHFLIKSDSFLGQRVPVKTMHVHDPNYDRAAEKLVGGTGRTQGLDNYYFDLGRGRSRNHFCSIVIDGLGYFVMHENDMRDDGCTHGVVLDTNGIQQFVQGTGYMVTSRTPGVHPIAVRGEFHEGFKKFISPQLAFFDDIVEKLNDKPSVGETFVVATLSMDVQRAMEAWRRSQDMAQPDKETITLLEQHLYESLNAPEIILKDGSTFDPRSITLFLLDDPITNFGSSSKASENSVVMSLGLPPLEGRKARAESTLKQALSQLKDDADRNLKLFGKPPLESITLNEEENAAFDALVAWDFKQTKRAREYDVRVPISALEQCVNDLVQRVTDRQTDYFGLNDASTLPTMKALESEWGDAYKPYLDTVELIIEQRAARARAEEARAHARRVAEQQKLEQEKAEREEAGRKQAEREKREAAAAKRFKFNTNSKRIQDDDNTWGDGGTTNLWLKNPPEPLTPAKPPPPPPHPSLPPGSERKMRESIFGGPESKDGPNWPDTANTFRDT